MDKREAMKVGTFVIKRLHEWGIRRVFGYPGDGINGLIEGFAKLGGAVEFVQARHEEMAAFMAVAHAKYTGEVGVCMATTGPGAIHLLNGLYDGKMDHQPVVAIIGQAPRTAVGGNYLQEVDLTTLFKDVAHEYVHEASAPEQVPHLIDRAMRIALAERSVTCVIIPKDVQELPAVEQPPHKENMLASGVGYSAPRVLPVDDELRRAAEVLNAGQNVAMLVGAGALGASDEVIQVAQRMGAGVAKALLGKAVVPDGLPFVTGSIGMLGTKASWELMQQCDTLLMVGSGFPWAQYLPAPGQARGVQIDLRGGMLSIRYAMEVNLQGDAAETLRALLPLLEEKRNEAWRQQVQRSVRDWWKTVEHGAMQPAAPLNPQRVLWELSSRLPQDCIIAADSGSGTYWTARELKLGAGMQFAVSGGNASMGCGLPYAIAAKFAYPERPVIAIVGDGAMQMNGLTELITVAKYRDAWSDQRFIVLVLNNRDLNLVSWEQRIQSGYPKFSGSQDLPDFSYARYAEMLGFKGIRVDNPEQVMPAWEEAFRADGPVLLEAVVDPTVPTLPQPFSEEQGKKLSQAVDSDPEGRPVAVQVTQHAPETVNPERARQAVE